MERNEIRGGTVAVAIDREKPSHLALKWAVEHYIPRSWSIKLVHVVQRSTPSNDGPLPDDDESERKNNARRSSDLMFPALRCLCLRRNIQSEVVLLEGQDVAKALVEYIAQNCIGTFVLGASVKRSITRLFKGEDIPSNVIRWAPDYCSVLVVSKGKLSSVRSATRQIPRSFPTSAARDTSSSPHLVTVHEAPSEMSLSREDYVLLEISSLDPDTDSAAGISTDSSLLSFYKNLGSRNMSGISRVASMDLKLHEKSKFSVDLSGSLDMPSISEWAPKIDASLGNEEEVEFETRRVKLELKQMTEMYHVACREASAAKQKASELETWKKKAEKRIRMAEEMTMAIVEMERSKRKEALEKAGTAQRLVDIDVRRRVDAEKKAAVEIYERRTVLEAVGKSRIVKKESLLYISVVLFLLYLYFSMFK
ncbi:PREDICTED: U-box domain-containing protein 51 [Tarenaya hassleriana]|uniref:U-box domain-containing protein 51 n=1 Tax=Tarenaya hassleriana TaxID=28532 RepID=UPI00053C9718|nr:PREDICTED: U-box domain-containing protein 51 [Tarenaya hassleriana]